MVIGIYIHYKNHAVLTWTRLLFNKSCTLYTSGIYDRVILIQKNWACCQVVAFCSQISELLLAPSGALVFLMAYSITYPAATHFSKKKLFWPYLVIFGHLAITPYATNKGK